MDYLGMGLIIGWSAWALMTTFRLNSHGRALDRLKEYDALTGQVSAWVDQVRSVELSRELPDVGETPCR